MVTMLTWPKYSAGNTSKFVASRTRVDAVDLLGKGKGCDSHLMLSGFTGGKTMTFSELASNPFGASNQKSSRVLMVINEPESLHQHSELLETLGCEVLTCDSYGDVLEMLQNGAFDFVTVGRGGTVFEGEGAIISAKEINRGVPVLVMARNLGMGDHLQSLQMESLDDPEMFVPHEELVRILRTHLLYSVGRQPDA